MLCPSCKKWECEEGKELCSSCLMGDFEWDPEPEYDDFDFSNADFDIDPEED